MTVTTTLTEDDIMVSSTYVAKYRDVRHWLQIFANPFKHLTTIEEAQQLKQQIISNQKVVDRLKELDLSFIVQIMRSNYETQKDAIFEDIANKIVGIQILVEDKR